MLNEAQMKSVALFFFFVLLDEKMAFRATVQTVEKCGKHLVKNPVKSSDWPALIVSFTYEIWKKWKKSGFKNNSLVFRPDWVMPEGMDLGVWQDFRRGADPEEFLCLLWSQVLKFEESQIAEGLGVSVGTVRHRVGRGARQLGKIQRAGTYHV